MMTTNNLNSPLTNFCIPLHFWLRYLEFSSIVHQSDNDGNMKLIGSDARKYLNTSKVVLGRVTCEYLRQLSEEARQRFWMAGLHHADHMIETFYSDDIEVLKVYEDGERL